jgi:hypothetical protein
MARHIFNTGWVALALTTLMGCQVLEQPGPSISPTVSLPALIIAQVGSGGGRIVSEPAGLNCPSACSAEFPVGTQVSLTAVPDSGWVFDGWSQACSGSALTCLVTMTNTQQLGFSFKLAPPLCDAPQVQCATGCVDTSSDGRNCGGCNLACAAGESCVAAACQAALPSCTAPNQLCGAQCTDTSSDASNCGGCDLACAAGESCIAAACTPALPSCMAPNQLCGTACVDTSSDSANCGSCGTTCATGESCVAALCMAP